jgi:hypothetical protein
VIILVVLTVGIILILVGGYMYNYGYWAATQGIYPIWEATYGIYLEWFGWVITVVAITACIVVVILYFSRREE